MYRLIVACYLILLVSKAHAQCFVHQGASLAEPVSVMGSHLHPKGELMAQLNISYMSMNGMKERREPISEDLLMWRYEMYGTRMPMQMGMVMYGVSNKINLMVMGHYMQCAMDMAHFTGIGTPHPMVSRVSGWGDTRLTMLYQISESDRMGLVGQFGLSLPTGSVENSETSHHGDHVRMGYPMQFGSGTLDYLASLTYTLTEPTWSLGLQPGCIVRQGINKLGYALGNQWYLSAWMGKALWPKWTCGGKFTVQRVAMIIGQDAGMELHASPSANPLNSGHTRVLGGVYTGWAPGKDPGGTSLHAEIQLPVYDQVNGVQMAISYQVLVGVKYPFGRE